MTKIGPNLTPFAHNVLIRSVFVLCMLYPMMSCYSQTQEGPIEYEGVGKIVLEGGQVIAGMLHYARMTPKQVSLVDGADYPSEEVKEFEIVGRHFIKVQVPGADLQDWDFALLLTDDAAQIKVYEVCVQDDVQTSTDGGLVPTYRHFLIKFPQLDDMKDLGDDYFKPFEEKVAALVSDCPDLSAKISNKKPGYRVDPVNQSPTMLPVFLRISEEYQNCAPNKLPLKGG